MAQFPANIDLSTLNGSNGFKLSGIAAGDQSGYSVAAAGDVNGDGFDDLIVGAPRVATPFGYITGASYVVFGKASGFAANLDLSSLDGVDGFKMTGYAGIGRLVASAGDVNGDGFGDLLIGSSGGRIHVVLGNGSGYTPDIDLSELGGLPGKPGGFDVVGNSNEGLGRSMASAGDFNGDGFTDLIFGASLADPNGTNSGASYVFFGKAAPSGIQDIVSLNFGNSVSLSGVAAYDQSGFSVASAGDVNGDGIDDLIVGAPYADRNQASSGASYVVFGKASGFAANIDLSSLNGSNGFTLFGLAAGNNGGWSVASAGDVNGDGLADLIVGALGDGDPASTDPGASYVVFGRKSGFDATINLRELDGRNGFKLSGVAAKDQSGWSVASAGDVNGDGFDDVIVGALRANPHGADSGASYVVFGKAKASGFAANIDLSSLDGSNGFKLSGVAAGDLSGHSLASAGDINGDGLDDLIVGAPFADPNGTSSGASYVIYGRGPDTAVARVGTVASQTLVGGAFGDALSGLEGDDRLFGNGGVDILKGGDGDDVLDGGGGADTLNGNAGLDTVRYLSAAAGVTVSLAVTGAQAIGGGMGNDTLQGIENAWGSAFDDALTGSRLDNRLDGFSGNDELRGGEGNDRLHGGNGDDRLLGGLGDDVLDGGGGADTLNGNSGLDTVTYVSSGAGVTVSLAMTGAQDTGGAGSDTLQGIENAVGTAYNDVLTGSDLDNRIEGGGGLRDILSGGAGADVLIGGLGQDLLLGEEGNDRLEGGASYDYLDGGTGADVMMGGDDFDRYIVDNALDVVEDSGGGGEIITSISFTLTASQGIGSLSGVGTADLTLTGTDDSNAITGSEGDDTLVGNGGNDSLNGKVGDDTLDGGGGDDTLRGHIGDDTLLGGDGNDRLMGETGNDRLEGGAGNDVLEGGYSGVDVLVGGNGDDTYIIDDTFDVVEETGTGYDRVYTSVSFTMAAGQGINFLEGDGNADLTLTGNQLANSIWGANGDDTIAGAEGADILRGYAGNDALFGGKGNDILEGGDGADRFRYRLGDGNDRFTDFSGASGDRVALVNVTVSQLVNNIATMSDGSILTAQTSHAWAASDFVLV